MQALSDRNGVSILMKRTAGRFFASLRMTEGETLRMTEGETLGMTEGETLGMTEGETLRMTEGLPINDNPP